VTSGIQENNERDDLLGQYLNFRNGKKSPVRSETGEYAVYGSNGQIGQCDETNTDGPSIVIGRVGSYCGSVYYSSDPIWVTDNAIVCEAKVADETQYWYYALQTLKLNGRSSGSGQPLLNQSILRSIKCESPSRSRRLAIAEVLGALDDKIAANTKLAKTSDDLAGSLFRQTLISATYSDETFADLARVSGGGTPSTKKPEYWEGEVSWATPTDVTALSGPYLEKTSRTISEAGLDACSSELYPAGSILMTSRATIGAFALAQVPTAVNQGFIVVQPNEPSLHFWLFHEMRSRVDEFVSLANGATFLELSRGNFKKFKVRKATPEIMAGFNETAAALHGSARAALLENASLAATRDALLPQLMSGKLRVKDAEKVLEDSL